MAVTILISVQCPESILTRSLNTNLHPATHKYLARIMVRPSVVPPTSNVLNSVL